MNILDTDALTHHMKRNPVGTAIQDQIRTLGDTEFCITAINAFEMVDGAVAPCKALKKKRKHLIPGFGLIQEVVEYLGVWRGRILPYDFASDQIYARFTPRLRQELGDDVRVPAIALARNAAVWTCNVDDFKRVPGLAVYRAETGVRIA